jgi:hypothetical protein
VTLLTLTPSNVGLPGWLSHGDWERILQAAAAAWSYPKVDCSNVQVEVLPAASLRRADDDGVNLVVFRDQEWCHNGQCGPLSTYPSKAAGMTTTYPLEAMGAAVLGGDIELNRHFFETIGREGGSDAGRAALEAVVVHEIGHVFGLRDVCGGPRQGRHSLAACSVGERERVMFASAQLREPSAADIAELCQLHPRGAVGDGSAGFALVAIGVAMVATLVGLFYAWTQKRRN